MAPKDTWTELSFVSEDDGLEPRFAHSAVFIGSNEIWSINMVIVYGGMNSKKEGLSDVAVLDVDNYTWLYPQLDGSGPGKRAFHSAAVIGLKMYVFGGHIMRQQK